MKYKIVFTGPMGIRVAPLPLTTEQLVANVMRLLGRHFTPHGNGVQWIRHLPNQGYEFFHVVDEHGAIITHIQVMAWDAPNHSLSDNLAWPDEPEGEL